MTFKSTRRPLVAALAGLTVISWLIADSRTSDAQLLRRLRDRIQSRIPAPQFPNNQLQPRLQPNVPPYNQQQRQIDPKDGLDPRRVAPVNPAEPRGTDAAKIDANSRLRPGTSGSPSRQTSPDRKDPNSDPDSFGRSILPKPNAKTAGVGQRKPAIGGPTHTPSSEFALQERASLGIQVVESRQGIPGLIVTGINPGSHAPSSGLKVGDLIVSIARQPTESVAEIASLLAKRKGGENLPLQIVRDRRRLSIDVPLMGGPLNSDSSQQTTDDAIAEGAKTQPANGQLTQPAILGLSYANVEGQRGALITDIQNDSPAAVSGLKTGDRIVAVDGRLLVSAEALQQSLAAHKENTLIDVRMVREGKLLSAKIDPLAKPTATDSLAGSVSDSANGRNESVLGSVGAIFGKLLNGNPKPKPSGKRGPDRSAVDELAEDEMALGDDEEVQQVDFESDIVDGKNNELSDPLSLNALEPPPIGEDDSAELLPPQEEKEKSPEELQKEIDELKRQIEAFQDKK